MPTSVHQILGILLLFFARLYASDATEGHNYQFWKNIGDMVLLQENWVIEYVDPNGLENDFTSKSSPINCITNFWRHINHLPELPLGSSWNFFKSGKHPGYEHDCNWDGGVISITVVEEEDSERTAVECWEYVLVWLIANNTPELIEKLNGVVFNRVDEETWTITIWHIDRFFGYDFKHFIQEMKSLDYEYNLGFGPNWKQERMRLRKTAIQ